MFTEMITKFKKYQKRINDLNSQIDKNKLENRFNNVIKNQRKKKRLSQRLQDLKRDIHNKTIKFLVKYFDIIFISYFPVGEISQKANSKANKAMYTWSHFAFRSKLITKSFIENKLVFQTSEHYTSKCCCKCQTYHKNPFRKNRVFVCKNCDMRTDRDVNGSKNILFKDGGKFINLE